MLLVYKERTQVYPRRYFEAEFIGLFVLQTLQALRIFTGRKGNKTEESSTTFLFTLLALPCVAGNYYYLTR